MAVGSLGSPAFLPLTGGTITGVMTFSNDVNVNNAGTGTIYVGPASASGVKVTNVGNTLSVTAGDGTATNISAQYFSSSAGTAIPAGGNQGIGFRATSTTTFGVYFGSGAPTMSAAQGSLYLRSDGSSTSTRLYVNTNGSTTWTNVTTAT